MERIVRQQWNTKFLVPKRSSAMCSVVFYHVGAFCLSRWRKKEISTIINRLFFRSLLHSKFVDSSGLFGQIKIFEEKQQQQNNY